MNKDIDKSKSKIASEQAKLINRNFNYKDLQMFVDNESECCFDENFWKKQDFI